MYLSDSTTTIPHTVLVGWDEQGYPVYLVPHTLGWDHIHQPLPYTSWGSLDMYTVWCTLPGTIQNDILMCMIA